MSAPREGTQARWVYDQIKARGTASRAEITDATPRIRYTAHFDRPQMLQSVDGTIGTLLRRGVIREVVGAVRPKRYEVVV